MNPNPTAYVWLEAPLMGAAMDMFPADVAVIAAAAEAPAYSNAAAAQAMIAASMIRYNGTVMDACPNLRLIARTGIGVDNVDLEAATVRGIVVTNTPDGPTESTAEHTVAMLLAVAKRLKQGNANLAAGGWGPRNGVLMGDEVAGKTLGLVGFGRIGRRVAQICGLGLGMRVLACDPAVDAAQMAAQGVVAAPLAQLIAEADFVSLHAPATTATYRLMNQARIAQMKRGAYLLNLARGPLVDEEALLAALDSGHLAGAGLDVFDVEPPEVSNRLRDHPNVVATPHMASGTVEGRTRMDTMAVERVLAFLRGERPADLVNPEVWERRRQ